MLLADAMLRTVDLIVLGAYVLLVVGLGVYLMRKSGSVEAFTLAGRSLPGWAVGLSILGTYLSSISFLALPGKAYGGNWNAFVFSLTLPPAAWIAIKLFLPLYRRAGLISAYQYLEERFGPWARVYAGASFILIQLGRIGAILYLVALVLSPLTGLNVPLIIIITGIVVTLYTTMGGIEAVIWTDVLQVIILMAGALIATIILLFDIPGGPAQTFDLAWTAGKFSLGSWSVTDWVAPTVLVVFIYGMNENLKNFGIDQNYIQRYNTAKSKRAAARSVWLGALTYIPVSAVFLFIGTALYAYYQTAHDPLPLTVTKPDEVFPHFIVTKLPVGVAGLVIAALFAAAMSSVDSSLNCVATICLEDVYKRFINPDADDARGLSLLRWFTIGWGVLGTAAGLLFFALVTVLKHDALDLWWTIAGIFGAGMLGPFLLGAFLQRVSNKGAIAGVIASLVYIAWATLARDLPQHMQWLECNLNKLLIGVAGAGVLLVVGILASVIWPPPKDRPAPLTIWSHRQEE
ncbi:MAG: sodium:solute symporter [Phycisphaerae bacterium]|nr:sodium:solute symporter [Phycisphaerae bacterium]